MRTIYFSMVLSVWPLAPASEGWNRIGELHVPGNQSFTSTALELRMRSGPIQQ